MEPRNDESKKRLEPCQAERKRRFQIVKLEERIAPRISQKGHCGHGECRDPGGR